MEIINKKHKEITVNKTVGGKTFIKFHNEKQIYFSITAVRELGLGPGLFLHVVNDENKWFFYVNNDNDGFPLTQQSDRNTLDIFNQALIHLFIKRTNHSLPCKFPLRITGHKKDGHHLIEILHNSLITN